jgi:hypothetical protein
VWKCVLSLIRKARRSFGRLRPVQLRENGLQGQGLRQRIGTSNYEIEIAFALTTSEGDRTRRQQA